MILQYTAESISIMLLICSIFIFAEKADISKCRCTAVRIPSVLLGGIMMFAMLHISDSCPISFSIAGYIIICSLSCLLMFGRICISHVYLFFMNESLATFFASCVSPMLLSVSGLSHGWADTLSVFIFRALLLFVICLMNDRQITSVKSIMRFISRRTYALIALAVILAGFIPPINNFSTEKTIIKQNLLNMLLVLFIFTVIIVLIAMVYNIAKHRYYADMNSVLNDQICMQLAHYTKLEKLQGEMRRFRHDYRNHLLAILALLRADEYSDARIYIEKLTAVSDAPSAAFSTGNLLADAILTDKAENAGEGISLIFQGVIPSDIDNTDLCTILSNALDNAVKACRDCGGGCIEAAAQLKQGYFVITVKNPSPYNNTFDGIPTTSKADTDNHGFGLLSIEQAVKKHDGSMQIHNENNIFTLSVTFSINTDT